MRLTRLAIQGFKSFADKTVLHFDSGITCIVGPNGCGKSNISDAFRWVLGESSAKSIRGSKMPDMIFSGTPLRPALNFAEVSLTIADVQGGLPVDYEEITLTRRLYRSGESEYLLNGNRVRLKDFRTLFLNSGVGRNAFSIFEQGKLDRVISFTPLERRHIFEEAAGILLFLERKKESTGRLEKSDINLSRSLDIQAEIETQATSLEEQAAKAKKYREHLCRLEDLEKAVYLIRKKTFEQKLLETNEAIAEQTRLLEECAENEILFRGDCNERLALVERIDVRLKEQSEQLSRLQREREKGAYEAADHARRSDEIRDRIKKIEKEREDLILSGKTRRNVSGQMEHTLESLLSEKNRAEEDWILLQTETKREETEVSALRLHLSEKQREHLAAVQATGKTQGELNRIEARIEIQTERKSALQELLQRMNADDIRSESDIGTKRIDLERLSDSIDVHRDRLDRYESECKELYLECEKTEKDSKSLRTELTELQARIKLLVRMREEHEGFSSGSKRLLKEAGDCESVLYRKVRPLYEFFSRQTVDAEAIAAVMHEYSQTLIVEKSEDYASAISFAEKENLEDYSLVCLQTVKEGKASIPFSESSLASRVSSDPLVRHFLGPVVLCSNLEELLLLNSREPNSEGWSPGGNFVDRRSVFFKSNSNRNGVFLRESELKELEEESANKERILDDFERSTEKMKMRLSGIKLEKEETDRILRRDEIKLVEVNFGLQKLLSDREKNKADRSRSEEEISILSKAFSELKAAYDKLSADFFSAQDRISELKKERESSEAGFEARENRLNARLKDQKEKEMHFRRLAEECQTLLHRRDLLQVQEQDGDKRLLQIEEELADLNERRRILLEKLGEINNKVEFIGKQSAAAQELRDGLTGEKKIADDRSREAELLLSGCKERIGKIENEIERLRIFSDQHRTNVCNVESELLERYGLTFAEAAALSLPVDRTAEQTEKEMRRLREKLQEAGNVNLAAVEELEKHRVRREFIRGQIEDMQHSKAELLKVIRELDSESRTLFRETFELVRENFKKNFRVLFEGGEADLRLTESTDILEAGIEIDAKPPGKQMRSISLLSGGEKCLTALALLFAIFEVRPAPFCILDEIDAPLDDTNVDRFVNVVKHFSDRCRFLIITHNKRTMAIGDVLFGVSMEEKGVSKLLSLTFTKKNAPTFSSVGV